MLKQKTEDIIFRNTPIIPELVAERVIDNPKHYEIFVPLLVNRANILFKCSPYFRKKIKTNLGRDQLEMFMRHWLIGYMRHKDFYLKQLK